MISTSKALILAVEVLGLYDLLLLLKVVKLAVLALVAVLATEGTAPRSPSVTSTRQRTFLTWSGETEQAHRLRRFELGLLERAKAGVEHYRALLEGQRAHWNALGRHVETRIWRHKDQPTTGASATSQTFQFVTREPWWTVPHLRGPIPLDTFVETTLD